MSCAISNSFQVSLFLEELFSCDNKNYWRYLRNGSRFDCHSKSPRSVCRLIFGNTILPRSSVLFLIALSPSKRRGHLPFLIYLDFLADISRPGRAQGKGWGRIMSRAVAD